MGEVGCETVFFPGAGSFGSEFQFLAETLGSTAWTVKYPGRFGKGFGVPAESFDALVQACTEQITARDPAPKSVVLFGHSFGSYVAYSTALRLHEESAMRVTALVVAGAVAPGQMEVPDQAVGSIEDAMKYLDAIDPTMLAEAPSDDWREIVAETAITDLRLLKQFAQGSSTATVACPILAARGDADPLTTEAGLDEWARSTNGAFLRRAFPGGHSEFLSTPVCASWMHEITDRFAAGR